ncbi:PEP-CTERM sorting domain-containing protein [Geoalkalibacter ferrihydriticus]|nr:PEP-CTERM sorting domain-containing protein [Geoalkalibacter ferrihydriticus]
MFGIFQEEDESGGGVILDPIPEPSTIILLGAQLLGLGLWHRRRKA